MTAPTVTPVVDWGSLTPAQQATVLGWVAPITRLGVEVVDWETLAPVEDITSFAMIPGGSIEWSGTDTVSRDIDITLTTTLEWGVSLIRVYRVVENQLAQPGDAVQAFRVNRGVFVLHSPDQKIGSTAQVQGQSSLLFDVQGQDRASLLDRLPGYSYVAPMNDPATGNPVTVLTALANAYTAAGLTGFLIDSSASASLMPRDMPWPMVSVGSDDTSSTDAQTSASFGDPLIAANTDSGSGATWRQIINDLHSLINYRAVWADENGFLRSTPYAQPALRASTLTIPAAAFAMDRTVSTDPWGVPNRWIFVWSNMPPDSSGNQQTPTNANGGIYQVDNYSDGPSSQLARKGLVFSQTYSLTAASASDLQTQGDAQVAADKRGVTTYSYTLRPHWVVFGHFDVVTIDDPALGVPVKAQVTGWTEHTDNQAFELTLESV